MRLRYTVFHSNDIFSFFVRKEINLSSLSTFVVTTNNDIAQDKCRDSTITYNVTLRGGIDAGISLFWALLSENVLTANKLLELTCDTSFALISGNFTERSGVLSMRDCIGKCCDDTSCDLAFMFGDHCYSVECQSEKLCQAVLAKPSHLEPKVSYVSRGFYNDKDKGLCGSCKIFRALFTWRELW